MPALTEAISFVSVKHDINNKISKLDDTKGERNIFKLINYSIELLNDEINRLKKIKKVYLFYTIEKSDPESQAKLNSYIFKKLKIKFNDRLLNLKDILNEERFFHDEVHYSKNGHEVVGKMIGSIIKSDLN